jgi:hypothetical protein
MHTVRVTFLCTPWRHTGKWMFSPLILNLALHECECQASHCRPLCPRKKRSPGNHWILSHRVDLVPFEKKINVYHLPHQTPKGQHDDMARSVCLLRGGGITKVPLRPVCLAGKEMSTNATRPVEMWIKWPTANNGAWHLSIRSSIPGRYKKLSLLQSIRISCGVYPGSCSVGTTGSFLGDKAAGPWT